LLIVVHPPNHIRRLLLCLLDQQMADLKVQRHERIPAVSIGVIECVLPVDPTDVRPLGVDRTTFAALTVVPAGPVAPVEKSGLLGQVDVLATQTALGARKGFHP
jgi:hypothetical protein